MQNVLTPANETHADTSWVVRFVQKYLVDGAIVLMFVLFCVVVLPPAFARDAGDFTIHNDWSLAIIYSTDIYFDTWNYYGYHMTTAFIYTLLGSEDVWRAGTMSIVISQILLMVVVYGALRWRFGLNNWQRWGAAGLILFLVLIAPIAYLSPQTRYFGYIGISIYHNPTNIFVKPFAVAAFLLSAVVFLPRSVLIKQDVTGAVMRRQRIGWMLVIATSVVLSAFAKPSATIALLPAICLFAVIQLVRRKPIAWDWFIGGVIIAGTLAMLYQLRDSAHLSQVGSPEIRPFFLFDIWADTFDPNANQLLWAKFLLSVAFPLVVYVTHWRRAMRSVVFNFAWVNMLVAAFFAYFVVYEGFASAAGDFIWSSYITNLILFVAAVIFLFRIYHQATWRALLNWQLILSLLVLLVHIVAGIEWYYIHTIITDPTMYAMYY